MLTITEIRDLRRAAESYWKSLHEAMEADYKEVDTGPGVTLEVDGEKQTTLNPHAAAVKVRTAVSHLIDADLEIRVDSGAPAKSVRERGDAIATALRSLHYHLTSEAKSDPHSGGLTDAATMGMAVWYVGTDFSRLLSVDARKPVQKRGESDEDYDKREDVEAWKEERARCLPIIFDHEDPRTIFPDPGTHGDLYCFKVERRTVGDIRRNWRGWEPQRNGRKRKSDFDEVEWIELWSAPGGLCSDDPGSYYYEADSIPIKRFGSDEEMGEEVDLDVGPWPHHLGFSPYVVWNAGYGMPRGNPKSVYKGIIRNAREGGLFRAKAEKRSQIHALSKAAAWHGWVVPEGYGESFELGFGKVNEMPQSGDGRLIVPQPVIGPPPAAALFSEAAALEADINAETISDVLSSPGSTGAEVALLYARQVQEAGMALGPLRRNAERAYDRVWERIGRILGNPELFGDEDEFRVTGIDSKGNPISVALGRRLFRGTHVYRTSIDPRFASDQIGRAQNGLQQLSAGTIDRVSFHREFSNLDNPEELVRKADADVVRRRQIAAGAFDDFYKQWISGQLPKDIKGRDWLKARMQAEQDRAQEAAASAEQAPAPGVSAPQAPMPQGASSQHPVEGAMVRPGGAMMAPGESNAMSLQAPTNGQGPGVV